MAPADEYLVLARLERLAEAIAFVEAFCADRGVAASDGLRLSLVVEELFTNTVVHGHGGGSDAPVRLVLRADSSHLGLSYEDSAPPFDPVAHAAPIAGRDPAAAVADRPIGHLGLALVVDMAERISYLRLDDRNRILLPLRREPELSTPAARAGCRCRIVVAISSIDLCVVRQPGDALASHHRLGLAHFRSGSSRARHTC